MDGDNGPKAEITARLRLPLPVIADLHQHLGRLLEEVAAPQKQTAH
ncbi:MAG: hypothetical protein JO056_04910 [Alphaproteobacteria bacterium]|nr:hypothetical protein [Alphaproteobacteria bacterium]